MRRSLIPLLLWFGLIQPVPPSRTLAEPVVKGQPTVQVTVDTTETPDLAPWGAKAKDLVEKWHPRIADRLKSDGFTPSAKVKLVFKKDMKGVAFTSRDVITIAAPYVKDHPEDWGMVVHELTHVVQDYRKGGPGWITEGIADYIRFFHFEPQTKLGPINPKRASYKDGYQTSAAFLAWVEKRHDAKLVTRLNDAMRRGQYKDELFKDYTGKRLDELWSDYLAAMKP